jgi:hypothetical protein
MLNVARRLKITLVVSFEPENNLSPSKFSGERKRVMRLIFYFIELLLFFLTSPRGLAAGGYFGGG